MVTMLECFAEFAHDGIVDRRSIARRIGMGSKSMKDVREPEGHLRLLSAGVTEHNPMI